MAEHSISITIPVLRWRMKQFLCWLGLLISVALASGCSSLAYYGQAVSGHLEVMQKSRPIEPMLSDPQTPAPLRERLETALAIRQFASTELALPENGSYHSYADLQRPYVVWNVIATPPLSLQPRQWCFLLVGCLQYRGYYSEADAREFASRLAAHGDDVYVGGATAYSTLGWFDDPVLNTMLHWDDARLAQVIFHELAHQQVFIKNDTAFNEAFADTVGMVGARRWLERHGSDTQLAAYEQQLERHERLLDMIFATREKLASLYAREMADRAKRTRKLAILDEFEDQYWQLRRNEWDNYPLYDRWFAGGLNNAKLAAVVTYRQLVPEFMRLLEATGNDLSRFYERVAALAGCPPAARRHWLKALKPVAECPLPAPALANKHASR